MTCPHCQVAFHDAWASTDYGSDADANLWQLQRTTCPGCKRFIFRWYRAIPREGKVVWEYMNFWPRTSSRPPAHSEVPETLSSDYTEACLVLSDSPKASAALSRRSLQHLLRDYAGTKKKDLFDQIEEIIESKTLPAHLADSLHQVRVIGNFAAHPTKSQTTGEIVEVAPHEAEWNLDTLEMLFDFYFVMPAAAKKRREALDLKLKDAGKPPLPPSGSEKM